MSNIEIKNLLDKFLKITQKINILLENDIEDKINEIESLFDERESIIISINSLEYSKNDFMQMANENNLIEENQILETLLENKKIEIQTEIKNNRDKRANLKKQRVVNNKYISINPLDPVFLSRKY